MRVTQKSLTTEARKLAQMTQTSRPSQVEAGRLLHSVQLMAREVATRSAAAKKFALQKVSQAQWNMLQVRALNARSLDGKFEILLRLS